MTHFIQSKPISHRLYKMFHWSPSNHTVETWMPRGGWNAIFSEKDKLQGVNLFFFLKKKGYTETVANTLTHMYLFKHKYEHLQYSKEQENMLKEALKSLTR